MARETMQTGRIRPIEARSYTIFGDRPLLRDGASAGYTGQVAEPGSRDYLLGNRPYLPSLRRFASADGLSPFEAGGFNRYAYCSGDPVGRVDPTGHVWGALFALLEDTASHLPPGTGGLGQMTPDVARAVTQRFTGMFPTRASRQAMTLSEVEAAGGVTHSVLQRGGNMVNIRSGSGWMPARPEGTRLTMDMPPNKLLSREYRPRWLKMQNARGKDIYLPDTVITPTEAFAKVESHVREQGAVDARGVVLLAGAHGSPTGLNWTDEGRWGNRFDVRMDRFARYVSIFAFGRLKLRGLAIKDLGSMSRDEFRDILNGDRTVIGGICFLVADEEVMKLLGLDVVDTFTMRRL